MLESVRLLLIVLTTIMLLGVVLNREKQSGDLLIFLMFTLYLLYLLCS
jgi:hypothetical protein